MDPIAKLFSLSSKLENLSDDKEKAISGYGYYDWGKSAFETSVTVAILPVWYTYLFLEANGLTTSIGSTTMTADAVWSLVVAISTLSVAIVSPPFGVIADRRLIKKKWLKILTYVGAGATFLLAFAPLFGNASWIWLMVMFLLANVGLNGAGVFYNALLPHLGREDEMDDISNRAFAYGYLGGGLLLVVHIGLVLGVEADWVIPFCMATAGLWWYGFALFTFMWVPEPPIENEMEKLKFREAARFAVGEVKQTLKDYKAFPTLFLYMLAYFFFIDGINTITALGGVYGVSVLGIGAFGLMLTILAIQFIAAPFAIIFTKIADRIGTKRALFISITGWVVLCFAALAFAPLELESHEDYDILYEWNESEERYTVHVSWSTHELAQKVDYEDEEFDEQAWAKEWSYLLPTKNSENRKLDTLEWAGGETEDEPNTVPLDGVANDNISSFLASVDDTRFSASVDGGELIGTASVGVDHPTSLGDGSLDFIPIWARNNIWEPFGLTVFLQFMILGCLMGTLLGGSQGLARSIFGQIVPETRSTEFFGFFGFFNKVAAFMGPMLYFFMTVTYDSRVGIFSIAFLLLIGAGLLYRVDIEAGRADARAEDERLRKILSESS
jgi:UMF1 family MFS transporter